MARKQCNECHGTYEDIGRDGVPYFHVCPPITLVQVKNQAGVVTVISLEDAHGLAIVGSDKEATDLEKTGVDKASIVVDLGRQTQPRPNGRDENPKPRDPFSTAPRVAKADGAGATTLP